MAAVVASEAVALTSVAVAVEDKKHRNADGGEGVGVGACKAAPCSPEAPAGEGAGRAGRPADAEVLAAGLAGRASAAAGRSAGAAGTWVEGPAAPGGTEEHSSLARTSLIC